MAIGPGLKAQYMQPFLDADLALCADRVVFDHGAQGRLVVRGIGHHPLARSIARDEKRRSAAPCWQCHA